MLEVRDLSLDRGGVRVLRNVSFRVAPGEVLAVVGPNGAGKTSLLEAVVGVRACRDGSVTFGAARLTELKDFAATFVYAPDETAPYVELCVDDVTSHADAISGARNDALARELGLAELGRARMGTLSRGERKRVALYVALSTTRPVAVLDEPLGVFDPLSLQKVVSTFRRRAGEGLSMIVTVHQLHDAEKVADRVLLLSSGRVVALGAMAELRARFAVANGSLEEIFERALGASDAST